MFGVFNAPFRSHCGSSFDNCTSLQRYTIIFFTVMFLMFCSDDLLQKEIYRWLNAPDPTVNHHLARQRCQAGTGQWLLQHVDFQNWMTSLHTFMWIYGIRELDWSIICFHILTHNSVAGNGKTILW